MNENLVNSYKKSVQFWKAKFSAKKIRLTGVKNALGLIMKKEQINASENMANRVLLKYFTARQIKLFLNGKSKTT